MTSDTQADPTSDDGAAATGFSSARLDRIRDFFAAETASGRLPGAVLLIERRGESVLKQAFGFRDAVARTPMTLDTIFRIYSMTKPLVSVATMMLAAQGRLHLGQPVSDFIPSFANLKVWTYGALLDPEAPPTIQDLLRHTAGLTYGGGVGPMASLYRAADLFAPDLTNEEFADRIATLPLAYQPGRMWDYSHATDVLGRVVEVVAGQPLSHVLQSSLLDPLGMVDTGFVVPADAHPRIAQALPDDTFFEDGRPLSDPRRPCTFEAGGMGLVSTLDDYAKFTRMLLAKGTSGAQVFLSPSSLRFMTADHIGPATGIARLPGSLLAPGFGFGLGFAVRTEYGAAPYPGSPGAFHWSGIAGTYFWVDPAEHLFVVLLTQSPRQRLRLRAILKTMVYDALLAKPVRKRTPKSARP